MKRREFLGAGTAALALPRLGKSAPICPPPTVTIPGAVSISTSCGNSTSASAAVAGGIPAYISGLNDWQVRNLAGQYAPTGTATLDAALPADWQNAAINGANGVTAAPFQARNILIPWCGGAADVTNGRLFVHGGGDSDGCNNGLFVYTFGAGSQPVGWSVEPNSFSAVAKVPGAGVRYTYQYSDYKPCSIHTYNGLYYDPNLNRFYRFSGSRFSNGGESAGSTDAGDYYDFANSRWSCDQNNGGLTHPWVTLPSNVSVVTVLLASPDGTQLLYMDAYVNPIFVNTSTGATTQVTAAGTSGLIPWGSANVLPAQCYDSTRGRYALFGTGKTTASGALQATVATVNWANQTVTASQVTLTGAHAGDIVYNTSGLGQGPSVVYDAANDCFLVFGFRGWDAASIYAVTGISGTTWTVTKMVLSLETAGQGINFLGGTTASYNRHIWFPNWRVIGYIGSDSGPASVIKVPTVYP